MYARSKFPSTRGRQRGISRFEAKFGAAVVALTITGVGYATSKAKSDDRAERSREAASKILKAAAAYADDNSLGCPTISSLKRDQLLDEDTPVSDAWGQRFRVVCADGLSVRSAGADGELQSADDVEQRRPAS
jgi:hypothetical protein